VRLLFDTNVILDVLLAREGHAPAASLFALVEQGVLEGFLGSNDRDDGPLSCREARG
jgi:predicted nucleic acid-binding protein